MTPFDIPSKDVQRSWRADLFTHLDGLALCGVVPVLAEGGMLDEVLSVGGDVDDLAAVFGANAGYLNVGLRMLCSQGILQAHRGDDKVNYMPRPSADVGDWVGQKDLYTRGRAWMEHAVGMWNDPETPLFQEAQDALGQLRDAVVSLQDQDTPWIRRVRTHLEGALVSPWLVALGTLHGTEPLTHWEDVDAAVAQLHPSKQTAWREVVAALEWDRSLRGGFFLRRA
ncbi:MAG: hypothetical protein ACPIA5_07820, partial [Flavobacteriales bacterium]